MARQERKERRKRRKAAKALKLQERIVPSEQSAEPRAQALPPQQKLPKPGVDLKELPPPKRPRVSATGGRFQTPMTWCARKADVSDCWSWGEDRQWTAEEWDGDIFPGLNAHENALWRDIEAQSSDSGHRMHHNQEIDSLCDEAKARWFELGLGEFDTAFRFRFGNKKRAWGIELLGHFYLIWWERYHRIYPTEPKNT